MGKGSKYVVWVLLQTVTVSSSYTLTPNESDYVIICMVTKRSRSTALATYTTTT